MDNLEFEKLKEKYLKEKDSFFSVKLFIVIAIIYFAEFLSEGIFISYMSPIEVIGDILFRDDLLILLIIYCFILIEGTEIFYRIVMFSAFWVPLFLVMGIILIKFDLSTLLTILYAIKIFIGYPIIFQKIKVSTYEQVLRTNEEGRKFLSDLEIGKNKYQTITKEIAEEKKYLYSSTSKLYLDKKIQYNIEISDYSKKVTLSLVKIKRDIGVFFSRNRGLIDKIFNSECIANINLRYHDSRLKKQLFLQKRREAIPAINLYYKNGNRMCCYTRRYDNPLSMLILYDNLGKVVKSYKITHEEFFLLNKNLGTILYIPIDLVIFYYFIGTDNLEDFMEEMEKNRYSI